MKDFLDKVAGRAARWAVLGACAVAAVAAPQVATAAISGTAFMDYNSNGVKSTGAFTAGTGVAASDAGVPGVTVNAYDMAGTRVATTTTAADGTYTICATGCTGTVRLEFTTPAGYEPSFTGANNETSVRFVSTTAAGVDFAVAKPAEYCQDNPRLVTCIFPFLSTTSQPGAVTLSSGLGALQYIDQSGKNFGDVTAAAPRQVNTTAQLGATFGVGVDRGGNAYFGTYVKRHSPYGFAGATNAIYKVEIGTGATSVFATLGSNALPAHVSASPGTWPDFAADGLRSDNNPNDVFHLVGRAGTGDVDVTPDGSTLYAVEMTEGDQSSTWPRLWKVPINGTGASASAGTPVSYNITKPATFGGVACSGKWHPMGIGMSASTILVGGVCGAEVPEPTRSWSVTNSIGTGGNLFELTLSSAPALSVGDRITVSNLSRSDNCVFAPCSYLEQTSVPIVSISGNRVVYDSGQNWAQYLGAAATSGTVSSATSVATKGTAAFVLEFDPSAQTFTTRAAVSLDYPKARGVNFDVIAPFTGGQSTEWHAWNDWDDQIGAKSPAVWSMPMLANIETRADGSLALAFRDRWMDQTTPNTIDYDSPPGSPRAADASLGGGDILLLCKTGSSYVKETNGVCGTTTGARVSGLLTGESSTARADSPLFYSTVFSAYFPYGHPYTGQGGVATMPGSPMLWSTVYDINNLYQQGVKALGPCAPRADTYGPCGPAGVDDGALQAGQVLNYNAGNGGIPGGCPGGDCWGKGNGLGDLELVCDAAPVQIGNRVWIDTNNNGIQDPGEQPAPGVTVRLFDATSTLVGTAVTDANGMYYFSSTVSEAAAGNGDNAGGGLTAGAAFTVRLNNPADYTGSGPLAPYVLTSATQSSTGAGSQSTAVDSNATLVSGYPQVSVPARAAGQNNHTFDIGFTAPIVVGMGDKTWIDTNSNGVQDAGEPALPGVVVNLLNPDGSPATDAQGNAVAAVTTDADGAYFIGNLLPGSYKARFTLPSGYAFTSTGAGASGTDSNPSPGVNPLIGTTGTFTIAGSATGDTTSSTQPNATYANLTIDAGVVPLVGMGDKTWIDTNSNGVQDAGEPALPGVVVQLMNAAGTAAATDAQGNPVASVTTDANGAYFIGNLLPGSYTARFTLPGGYTFTTSGAGTSATDSNPTVTVNANTKQTPVFTIAGSATGDTTISSAVNAKFANLTIDAGVIPLVGMGNYTWIDANVNGIQDAGEQPLSGVVVQLLDSAGTAPATDANGNPVASVITDSTGHYFIGNLLPGTYRAQFDLPDGYRFTSTGGGTAATDSNPVPTAQARVGVTPAFAIDGGTAGNTTSVTHPQAQFANLTVDAGVVPSSSPYTGGPVGMGNYVWIDTNSNGIQDAGEPPLEGVIVTLLTSAGQPAVDYLGSPVPAATTDQSGRYFIGNLDAGNYKARFTLPGGYMFTSVGAGTSATDSNPTAGANPLIGTTGTFTIAGSATGDTTAVSGNPTANFANLTIDAGVTPVVGMGNYTWVDADADGVQDAGEAPLAGVIVQLLNSAGTAVASDAQGNPVSPVVTDAAGEYFVGNLLPGSYAAQFTLPDGYIFTSPASGTSANDSNPTPISGAPQIGRTSAFTIAGSATGDTTSSTQPNATYANLTIDAGVVPLVGMGDKTWIDTNSNGVQDAGEPALPGVVVQLMNAAGTAAATDAQGNPVASVTTDANGAYFIGNLLPGSYTARFTLPGGYQFTSAGAGPSGTNSDPSPGPDPSIGMTGVFTIRGSATGDTTSVTGRPGASFANLTIDAGVVPSGGGATGGDPGGGTGGSPVPPSATPPVVPNLNGRGPRGTNSNGVSGGPGSTKPVPGANSGAVVGVGDLVWFDANRNGIQDFGELPMRGARVFILNANGSRARGADGKVIPAQTTNAAGRYFFGNIQPGRYRVRFIYPASHAATIPQRGTKATGSNAVPTRKANVAVTPVFVVAGKTHGETRKTKSYAKAQFANLSIDAGVIAPWAGPGTWLVTG